MTQHCSKHSGTAWKAELKSSEYYVLKCELHEVHCCKCKVELKASEYNVLKWEPHEIHCSKYSGTAWKVKLKASEYNVLKWELHGRENMEGKMA